ncbi:MAG: class I SAM-dependent methyltransferase [Chloroflexi bacterium]|nr:class I SAM-dependent methyltransferase [Chloroflexota bacterium]
MDTAESTIKTLSAGRVLDVATGNGQFINFLIESLKDYDEIIGIDTSEKAAVAFAEAFKDKPQVRFVRMDAVKMNFPDASFDTVCISNSLHHMPDLEPVLAEMRRVLRPGGHFIIAEMYRDNPTETQMTHVLMHHWLAAVDTAKGIVHNETYIRQRILDILAKLEMTDMIFDDASDLNEDPKNPETVKSLIDTVDQYLKRIEGLPGEAALRERGLDLRQRVEEIGFHSATSLRVIGKRL